MGLKSIDEDEERDLEKGIKPSYSSPNLLLDIVLPSPSSTPRKTLVLSNSGKALMVSASSKSLGLSNSGKRFDKKKYVKQVTGRHNDTELHLAVKRGDFTVIKQILDEIDAQMIGTLSGAEFDAEVAEIRSAVVNEVNELGETALFAAAERGHLEIVKELLKYTTEEAISLKNRSGFDPLHIAASHGHEAIVQELLDYNPALSKTVAQSNATPLVSAAAKGHTDTVKTLLSYNPDLLEIPKNNGKNSLHLAARQGHVEIVKALLHQDPQLARRTDKKGQTALHMAVKGVSLEVVRLLLDAEPAIIVLPDRFGNTALHVAARKKRTEMVSELLRLRETNVNSLTRDNKTAYDIVDGLHLSEETSYIKSILARHGGCKASELNQPRDELRKTVTHIKKQVHMQLEQTRATNKNVSGIAKELRRLHREGINNATNSVTVVASLFATVAFAAIFTVPGGVDDNGLAVTASVVSFKIFFVTNALALFTSLAVVLVQITIVRGETKAERRVIEVINKLMWLASVFTTVAFISSSYIVVGRHNKWAAVLVTVIGGVIMSGVLSVMTYYVLRSRRRRKVRKKEKHSRSAGHRSWHHSDDTETEENTMYAI